MRCRYIFHVDEKHRNHDAGGARVRYRRRVSVDLVLAPGEAGYQLREPPPDQPRLEVRPLEELAEDALEDARGRGRRKSSRPFLFSGPATSCGDWSPKPVVAGAAPARLATRPHRSVAGHLFRNQGTGVRFLVGALFENCGCSSLSRARRCQRRGSRGRTGHPLRQLNNARVEQCSGLTWL